MLAFILSTLFIRSRLHPDNIKCAFRLEAFLWLTLITSCGLTELLDCSVTARTTWERSSSARCVYNYSQVMFMLATWEASDT